MKCPAGFKECKSYESIDRAVNNDLCIYCGSINEKKGFGFEWNPDYVKRVTLLRLFLRKHKYAKRMARHRDANKSMVDIG